MKKYIFCLLLCLVLVRASYGMDMEEHGAEAHEHHMAGGMEATGHMMSNPAFGGEIFQAQPDGMWMVNYRFSHTSMKGLLSGTKDAPLDNFNWGNYMMAPLSMSMDMHMVMVMYGITDRFTLMGMSGFQANKMEMQMGFVSHPPVRTSGLGDTVLTGVYKLSDFLTGGLGVSIPTGSINHEISMMDIIVRAPYDMQLGSGTYDLKPSLTYSVDSDDENWNWGAQAGYTYHMGKNSNDYSLGDNVSVTSWLLRVFGPVNSSLRLAFNDTGRIKGQDAELAHIIVFSPDNDTRNYGGRRIDGLIGAGYSKGPVSLGIEGGVPIYQNLNGIQLKTTAIVNFGIQVMF